MPSNTCANLYNFEIKCLKPCEPIMRRKDLVANWISMNKGLITRSPNKSYDCYLVRTVHLADTQNNTIPLSN